MNSGSRIPKFEANLKWESQNSKMAPERLMGLNDGRAGKKYDLEERTALFAERVRDFCLKEFSSAE